MSATFSDFMKVVSQADKPTRGIRLGPSPASLFVLSLLFTNIFGLLLSVSMLPALGGYVTIILLVTLGSLIFAGYLLLWIMSGDDGTHDMQSVADAIREGSEGFLRVQYGTIFRVSLLIAASLFSIYLFRDSNVEIPIGKSTMAFLTAMSFMAGSLCSALAGYVGVWIAVRSNVRVAGAANQGSFPRALQMAMNAGAFSSIVSTAMCILGMAVLYTVLYTFLSRFGDVNPHQLPMIMVGYGFGASFVALMMQMGGGIYTKAADVGADMVGKIESGIPEDDPRNPAVVADLVGDNVGDCAGSMADVFESIAAEILGTMILGAALSKEAGFDATTTDAFIYFPLVIHSFDLIASSVGLISVGASDSPSQDALAIMRRGYFVCIALAGSFFVVASWFMLGNDRAPDAWWHFAACGLIGIAMAYLLQLVTSYYTDYQYAPVRRIAQASTTGHGTNIISGLAVGMESCAVPTVIVVAGLLTTYQLGATSGLPHDNAGLFGTATATTGMLSTAVYVLMMNDLGAIVDNAGGIAEMGNCPEHVRDITDKLDAVGNVTKASTKGYAVGGSALACFVLFRALIDEVSEYSGMPFKSVDIAKVEVLCGGMLGIMMIFLFSGWTMAAVGITAQDVVREVRAQFQEKPGIMNGTDMPDYDRCVSIVTRAALREMLKPALLVLVLPVCVGFLGRIYASYVGEPLLGVEIMCSFLIFAAFTGLLCAVFLDVAGGAWDNAKKYIELGNFGGKNSDTHKASVTGDTVGDPCKDTVGPSLHVLISSSATLAITLAPFYIATPASSIN